MKRVKIIIFIFILGVSIFLRFYQLGQLPPGINADEASLGYDAYSLLLTGKDQYGKVFPVFLRSFGAYQSPLYAYLTTLPISLFGLSVFSVRFLSALVGVLTILLAFIIISRKGFVFGQALLAAFTISIAPWSIFYSRTAVEANLGLFLVVMATYFLLKSLEKPIFFVFAGIVLGISTYAYQAQRLGAILFILGFILLFWKSLLNRKKLLLIGLAVFFICQIPQLMLINTQAGTRRLNQVNYFSRDYFNQNSGSLKFAPFGYPIFVFNEFSSHYLTYLSPKNLFLDPDPQEVRSIPDLSVFYSWMIIPFLFGLKVFWEKRREPLIKVLTLLMIISIIPAALTREPFYTLRVLPALWVLSVIIAFGGFKILTKFRSNILKLLLLFSASAVSLVILYSSYFVLLKYERDLEYGYPYIQLARKSEELNSKKFMIDSGRQSQAYIWLAFFKKYDPTQLQAQGKDVLNNYYDAADFDGRRTIGNVEIRPNDWDKDPCTEQIIVGDPLAISESQAKEHGLDLIFKISDLSEKYNLTAYATNPKKVCRLSKIL